jgi:hypothetical protein
MRNSSLLAVRLGGGQTQWHGDRYAVLGSDIHRRPDVESGGLLMDLSVRYGAGVRRCDLRVLWWLRAGHRPHQSPGGVRGRRSEMRRCFPDLPEAMPNPEN